MQTKMSPVQRTEKMRQQRAREVRLLTRRRRRLNALAALQQLSKQGCCLDGDGRERLLHFADDAVRNGLQRHDVMRAMGCEPPPRPPRPVVSNGVEKLAAAVADGRITPDAARRLLLKKVS